MAGLNLLQVQQAVELCTQIDFILSEESLPKTPALVLGFPGEESRDHTSMKLSAWAKELELIAAIHDRSTYIDLSLIHSGSYEVVNARKLSFDIGAWAEFGRKESQGKPLSLIITTDPIDRGPMLLQNEILPPLGLLRYIMVR